MKFVIAFLSFIVQLNFVLSVYQKPRIAIIGSGIGGAACGMFLNARLGRTVEIHIYEANKENGGRINTITHKGNVFELGAQTILKEDKSTQKYVDFFELKKVLVNKNKLTYAVYDGQQLTQMNMVYKLADGFKISEAEYQTFSKKVEDEKKKVNNKKKNFSYKTALDMLKLITIENNSILHSRVHECLNREFYTSDIIVKECEALLLRVYGQLENVPALPGYFTVKSVQPGAYSIKGGNIQLVEKFLSRTKQQKTYRETVVSIRSIQAIDKKKKPENDSYYCSTEWKEFDFQITSVDEKKVTHERNYDYVVVGTSLTENMEKPIKFLNFSEDIIVKGKFHKKFITIVEGDLESHYFNDNKNIAEKAGNIIFRNSGNIDFISKLGSVKVEYDNKSTMMSKKEDGASTSKKKPGLFNKSSKKLNSKKDLTTSEIGVWKIQSQRKLSEEEIQKLFQRRTIIAEKEWLAYPNYKEYNLDKNDRFELRYGLYYINCIEWVASSIEMSIIGAKNIATLIADSIFIPTRK